MYVYMYLLYVCSGRSLLFVAYRGFRLRQHIVCIEDSVRIYRNIPLTGLPHADMSEKNPWFTFGVPYLS